MDSARFLSFVFILISLVRIEWNDRFYRLYPINALGIFNILVKMFNAFDFDCFPSTLFPSISLIINMNCFFANALGNTRSALFLLPEL